jgi:DNA-binding LacI/PurR family transcriptional regulator
MTGLRDIARAVNLSVATVSRALRDDPAVARETVLVVKEMAGRMGYRSNPRVGNLMSSLRRRQGRTFRGNLGLIWMDASARARGHEDLIKIQSTARMRADELGYSLDEFILDDHRPEYLLRILKSRGIQGLLFSPSYQRRGITHLRLPLDTFSAVAMGWVIARPPLHSVRADQYQAMALAMHHARHLFKKGVAAICDHQALRRSNYVMRACFLDQHPLGPAVAQHLFFDHRTLAKKQMGALLSRYKIQGLIVQRESDCPGWLDEFIPPRFRIYLERPSPSAVHAGWINRDYFLTGQWGVEMLVDLVQRGEKGIPMRPKTILVPPGWRPARAET